MSSINNDISQLKKIILDSAIRGKLVPQDGNDEDAGILLEKIKAEKEKLIKEVKIRKENPLPEIKSDDIPFEIPKSWRWVRLGEIGETSVGLTYKPNDISEAGIPVLRSSNIQNDKLYWGDLVRVKKSIPERLLLKNGDIVICARNGSPRLVGKSVQINDITENITFGAFMAYFRSICNGYIIYFINSKEFRKVLGDVNTTTINQITQSNLKQALIPLPPLSEQQRIVAKIESLFKLADEIDSHRISLVEKVKQLKLAILQEAITGKLVPQDENDEDAGILLEKIKVEKEKLIKEGKIKKDKPLPEIKPEEIPFELPKSWRWVRLIEVSSNLQYGYTASATVNSQMPKMLRITDIQNNKVNWDYVPNCIISDKDYYKFKLENKDILFARTGGTVGKTFLVNIPSDVKSVFASYLIRLKVIPDPEYIHVFLNSPLYWELITKESKGTGQPNVNAVTLGNLLMPLPPLKEQKRIVKKVIELQLNIEQLKQKLNQSKDLTSNLNEAILNQTLESKIHI